MKLNRKHLVLAAVLVAVAAVASGCELSLPAVDCSDITQPDMGGLVCLGRSVATLYAGLAAILALLALAAGSIPT